MLVGVGIDECGLAIDGSSLGRFRRRRQAVRSVVGHAWGKHHRRGGGGVLGLVVVGAIRGRDDLDDDVFDGGDLLLLVLIPAFPSWCES